MAGAKRLEGFLAEFDRASLTVSDKDAAFSKRA
jgi:hypothetical protein